MFQMFGRGIFGFRGSRVLERAMQVLDINTVFRVLGLGFRV